MDGQGNVLIVPASSESGQQPSVGQRFERVGAAYRPPVWEPTGRFVFVPAGSTIWRVDASRGTVDMVATIDRRTVVDLVSTREERLWSPDGGRSLVAVVRDEATMQMGFYAVDLASGKSKVLLEGGWRLANPSVGTAWNVDVSADGQRIAFVCEAAQQPPDVWLATADFRRVRQVTHLNPQLERYTFARSRIIDWLGPDGQQLRGAVLLPPGYQEGKRYPLIVHLYGGVRLSRYANVFGGLPGPGPYNLQLLATRGYAVLYPDAPLRVGAPMADLAQTVLPGVNKAIELGLADPERLGVMGQSFGGYSVLALVTQTPRFKAAVVEAGYGNVLSSYGYLGKDGSDHFFLGWNETEGGKMGDSPWAVRERYLENSPTLYLDRVRTPVLLIHGTADDGVRVFQAEDVFVGLRRLGRRVVLARYEGEGHRLGEAGEHPRRLGADLPLVRDVPAHAAPQSAWRRRRGRAPRVAGSNRSLRK